MDVGVKPIFDLLMRESANMAVTGTSSDRLSADNSYPSSKSKSTADSEEPRSTLPHESRLLVTRFPFMCF